MYYPDPEKGPWVGIERVPAPPGAVDVVALRVRGVSMEPVYRNGDLLYIHQHDGWDVESCIGKDCVVELAAGQVYVKRLERHNGKMRLVSHNHPVMNDAAVVWASPIEWVKRA